MLPSSKLSSLVRPPFFYSLVHRTAECHFSKFGQNPKKLRFSGFLILPNPWVKCEQKFNSEKASSIVLNLPNSNLQCFNRQSLQNAYPRQYFVTAPVVSRHGQSCVASCEYHCLLLLLIIFFSLQKTPMSLSTSLDKLKILLSTMHMKTAILAKFNPEIWEWMLNYWRSYVVYSTCYTVTLQWVQCANVTFLDHLPSSQVGQVSLRSDSLKEGCTCPDPN